MSQNCTWCGMRAITPSGNSRPIQKAAWKAKVSKDSHILAGQEIYLCNYHKKGVALKFDSIEELK